MATQRSSESFQPAGEPPGHIDALNRPADQELARRSMRVAMTYVPATLLVTLATPLRSEALLPALAVTLMYLVTGLVRIHLCRSFDRLYGASPRRWQAQLSLCTLFPAVVWGTCNALVLVHFGLDWTYYLLLLMTVAIAASATTSLSPRLWWVTPCVCGKYWPIWWATPSNLQSTARSRCR